MPLEELFLAVRQPLSWVIGARLPTRDDLAAIPKMLYNSRVFNLCCVFISITYEREITPSSLAEFRCVTYRAFPAIYFFIAFYFFSGVGNYIPDSQLVQVYFSSFFSCQHGRPGAEQQLIFLFRKCNSCCEQVHLHWLRDLRTAA